MALNPILAEVSAHDADAVELKRLAASLGVTLNELVDMSGVHCSSHSRNP